MVARLADQLFCKVSTIQDGVSSLPGAAGLLWLRRTYKPGCVAGGRREAQPETARPLAAAAQLCKCSTFFARWGPAHV